MNKLFFIVLYELLFSLTAKTQISNPVHWSYAAKRIGPSEAVVFLRATIDDGWHIYSQNVKDGGPVKTTISFNVSRDYNTLGSTVEPKPISRLEKVFKMDVSFFERSVTFQQRLKVKLTQTTVTGKLEYMTCNDHQCLPPEDIDFSILVK